MHPSTFEYLKPTASQLEDMAKCREKAAEYGNFLDGALPDGPDKTYILRKFRELTMWVNVCLTRLPDGTPRT